MFSYQKIAKVLRTDKDNIRFIDEHLSVLTGKKNVMDKIIEENHGIIDGRLRDLDIVGTNSAKEIYDALIKKIDNDNKLLFEFLGRPSPAKSVDCQRILDTAAKSIGQTKGFFLKKEKAIEMLKAQPPLRVLKVLGYNSIEEMLKREDVFEIYGALRFIEGGEWMNNVFLKRYKDLKPEDFEYRGITVKALSEHWAFLAKDFIAKKHHNISHIKELGLIYVIPLEMEAVGATLRNFSLIIHYFNEIPFYSSLFEKFSQKDGFSENVISLLRGDVLDKFPKQDDENKMRWLVIQRYLSKDDENDWRLFIPHINPEALHWERAERMLIVASEKFDGLASSFAFWQNLNWVGDYFKSETGIDLLVSFNLVDSSMSLVKEKEMTKYLYHHQESLWNKIFTEYFGEEKMVEIMKENIIKGWFEV